VNFSCEFTKPNDTYAYIVAYAQYFSSHRVLMLAL
jgi:hypothetical protein